MTIFDYITAKEIAAYYNTQAAEVTLPPYLGEELFPNKKQLGLDLSFIKGAKGLAKILKLSAFDAKTVKRDRIGFEKLQTEMPFFKEGMSVDEKTRQELLRVMQTGNQAYIDMVLNKIFADEITLMEGAAVVRERMRMQLLSSGVITMANNGQTIQYDYGVPSAHKVNASTPWSTVATADPIADITAWQDLMEASGYGRPTRAITSRRVLRAIAKIDSVKNAIYVLGQGKVTPDEASVRAYIADKTGVDIVVYEKYYKDVDDTVNRMLPDDLFILIPEGVLGNTYFGTTPEEADLMASNIANVAIVDTGVAITTSKLVDPVNVDTKVSQVCLPSFEAADQIIIADVM